jgi:MazG family protein
MADLPKPSTGERFARLVEIMARLRADGGCPWDREQTFDSIKPYTLEEVYEVLDSIDARDWPALAEELGDLLLQCVFYAQMAAEEGRFTIDDSLDAINEKLIRRHPHVFGEGDARTPAQVKQRWDEIKAEEKKTQGAAPRPLLDGISRSQPALAEAAQISSKAASVGFDWESIDHVMEKLHEELGELAQARGAASGRGPREGVDSGALEEEIGDVLFVVVNIARHLAVDPEQALRKANAKFRRRFGLVEARLSERGRPFGQASLDEMEDAWQEAKRQS